MQYFNSIRLPQSLETKETEIVLPISNPWSKGKQKKKTVDKNEQIEEEVDQNKVFLLKFTVKNIFAIGKDNQWRQQ